MIFVMKDGIELQGILKKPKGNGSFPAVIFLHSSSGMGDYGEWTEYLSKSGFVGVAYARRGFPFGHGPPNKAIRFRDYIFKDIDDLKSVIKELKNLLFVGNAPLCVIGVSEGAQIAYLASSQIPGLCAVVGVCGVTDYLDWYKWAVTKYPGYPVLQYKNVPKSVAKIFGGTPSVCRDRYLALSPIHHVEQISCPVMIVQGDKDPQIPVRQTYQFAKALRDSGKTYELFIYPNEGHFQSCFSIPNFGTGPGSRWLKSQIWTEKNSQDLTVRINIFLNKYLSRREIKI